MNAIYKVQNYLTKSKPAVFIFFCSSAAFLTYCSMYAFRKPFTAGTYQGLSLFGVDYKVSMKKQAATSEQEKELKQI